VSGIFGVVNAPAITESLARMGAVMTGSAPDSERGDPAFERAGLGVRSNRAFAARKVPFIDGDWIAVFDGVLFGGDGAALATKSYAQITLESFLMQGEDFASGLRGSFATAFYDRRERRLWLYSDPFSSKPIYYLQYEEGFYFASELKALLAEGTLPAELHDDALREAFAMGYVCGSKTLIRGVERLPPGSFIRFDGGQGIVSNGVYFSIRDESLNLDQVDKEERLAGALRLAVDRGLDFGGASGSASLFTLSGGLDSRMVCALAKERGVSPLVTLTIAEAGSAEQRLASRAAEALASEHRLLPYDDGQWMVDHLDAAVEAGDGMHHFIDSARMHYALPAFEGRGFGVLQTGMSGDFIFGSFLKAGDLEADRRPAGQEDLLDQITHRLCMGLWGGLELLQDQAGHRAAFVKTVRESIATTIPEEVRGLGRLRALEVWNLRNRQTRGIFGYYRGAEAYMEYYSPFYDPDLFKLAFRLPADDRLHEKLYIKVLRERILPPRLAEIPWAKTGLPIVGVSRFDRITHRMLRILRKRVQQPIHRGAWRRSSGDPYLYWVWKNQRLRDSIRDTLVEFDRPEIFHLERSRLIRFLDEWHRSPLRYGDCLLHLLYLLAIVRWLNNHKHQIGSR
jgi:asparagine synthetase B (glutamine-hydrolysing)